MIKANQFQELIKQAQNKQLEKQKRIQEDMKLVEDTLNDLYIKIQKCLSERKNPPKYTEISKILEKEVQDNLMFEQNFYLDITKNKHTRIYYNKEDFDNRIPSNERYPMADMVNMVSDKMRELDYREGKKIHNQESIKKDKEKDNVIKKNISYKGMPVTIIGNKEVIDLVDKLNTIYSKEKEGWCRY
jgi:hypothetical protein